MSSAMPTGTYLTTWKEIASYVGKSVRTVQRWERDLGLPVRRGRSGKTVLLAVTSELDEWVVMNLHYSSDQPKSRTQARSGNRSTIAAVAEEVMRLRKLREEMRKSTAELRRLREQLQQQRAIRKR